jgi:hypothetical protein
VISLPADFHWVLARSKCSIAVVFTELQLGAVDDAKKAQSTLSQQGWPTFEATNIIGNSFCVVRAQNPLFSKRVEFSHSENEIQVRDDHAKLFMTATLTLTNEGECKLKVGDQELEQWQFRRMALEGLFFPAQ